jgi:hypothetical protein
MTKLSDTSKKVENIHIGLMRKLTASERMSRLRALSQTVMNLSRRAIRRANPELNENELKYKFLAYHYGDEIAEKYRQYVERKR